MKSRLLLVLLVLVIPFMVPACSKEEETPGTTKNEEAPVKKHEIRKDALEGGPFPTLLIAKAQFIPEPGPAKLVMLRKTAGGWKESVVEDPMSNVLHKAMPFNLEGEEPGILTIGAQKAALKVWRWKNSKWEEELLWQPSFGGKFDRLRDIEIGDVTGDGKPEMVIATHDQGVVAVIMKKGEKWEPVEVDRKPNTFVHEVEIGDVDGDGKNEFFVTPSDPNKADISQAGLITMFRWNGEKFEKTVVDKLEKTHVKEILAADMDGKGISTLFSVSEAEKGEDEWGDKTILEPVKIKRYIFGKEGITSEVIGELKDDSQCRFLCPGDINRDGRIDLVAAGKDTGLWVFWRHEDGSWKEPQLIDGNSSGFEHSTFVSDLDKDKKLEIYVAADDQKAYRKYTYENGTFEKEEIGVITGDEMTWNIMTGEF